MGIAELEFASLVEKTLTVKPFYDETIKVESPANNKLMVDFKRPSEMSCVEYICRTTVKYTSLFSINKDLAEVPICLSHLLIVVAY